MSELEERELVTLEEVGRRRGQGLGYADR